MFWLETFLSLAPSPLLLSTMKKIGEKFPSPTQRKSKKSVAAVFFTKLCSSRQEPKFPKDIFFKIKS